MTITVNLPMVIILLLSDMYHYCDLQDPLLLLLFSTDPAKSSSKVAAKPSSVNNGLMGS